MFPSFSAVVQIDSRCAPFLTAPSFGECLLAKVWEVYIFIFLWPFYRMYIVFLKGWTFSLKILNTFGCQVWAMLKLNQLTEYKFSPCRYLVGYLFTVCQPRNNYVYNCYWIPKCGFIFFNIITFPPTAFFNVH